MTDEAKRPSIKDIMGNEVNVGDYVSFNYKPGNLCVAKIVDIKEGGLSLALSKGQQGLTPTQVRLTIDITLTMDPRFPAFVDIAKIATIGSDEVLKKALEGGENPPGHGPKLVS